MRTRRSWRNQDRLYRAIGAELAAAARAWVATWYPADGSPAITITVYGRNATAAEEQATRERGGRVVVRSELGRR